MMTYDVIVNLHGDELEDLGSLWTPPPRVLAVLRNGYAKSWWMEVQPFDIRITDNINFVRWSNSTIVAMKIYNSW